MITEVITIIISILLITIFSVILEGIRSKVKALLQMREGGEITHEIYDLFSLLSMKGVLPTRTSLIHVLTPYMTFSLSVALGLSVPFGLMSVMGGDILVVILVVLAVAFIVSVPSMVISNIYANIGASREVILVSTGLMSLVVACSSFVIKFGTLSIVDIAKSITLSLSDIIAICVIGYAVYVLSEFTPFDISRSETEIINGVLSEYGGRLLGLMEWSLYIRRFSLIMFFSTFLAAPLIGKIFGFSSILSHFLTLLLQIIFVASYYVIASMVEERHARARVDHVIRLNGVFVLVGLISVVLSLIGM